MREMGFKMSTDLIPRGAVPRIQLQTPQQQALSEVRIKRTMESEETEKTAGKSSKRSRKSRAIRKTLYAKTFKKIVLVFKHRHFPFFICFKPYVYVCR